MVRINPQSILSKAIDFTKRMINPIINEYNYHATKLGQVTPIQRFETQSDRDAATYQKVVEARNMLRAGSIRDDPRNQRDKNFVYRGLVEMGAPRKISNPAIVPTSKIIPSVVPTKKIIAQVTQPVHKIPTKIPTITVTPTPTINQQVINTAKNNPYYMNFKGYKINKPGFEGKIIPQPPQYIAKIIHQVFGPTNEATPAAAVAWSENGTFNPTVVGQPNINQTRDYGLFQINSGTFSGLWKRRPEQMKAIGAYSLEDLKNPQKNAQVAQLIRMDEQWAGSQPWGQWYGWQGKGLGKDINIQEMIRELRNTLAKKRK